MSSRKHSPTKSLSPGWRHRPIGRLAAFRPAAQADLSLSCLRPCQRPPLNHRHGAHAPRVRQRAPARRTGALITSLDLGTSYLGTVSYLVPRYRIAPRLELTAISPDLAVAPLVRCVPGGARARRLAAAAPGVRVRGVAAGAVAGAAGSVHARDGLARLHGRPHRGGERRSNLDKHR